ncbi:family 10 glycosylhydrolase [Streptomyces sp. NPDC005925]|uniref:glycoside hydrolase family 10 protein n=1 Tax=Streptomyces sp. NPDC005925 TaxID=3157172 RepID=UPI0033D8A56D
MPLRRPVPATFIASAALLGSVLAMAPPLAVLPANAADSTATASATTAPSSVSHPLDAVDPTAETNPGGTDPASGNCFPGCRGVDQLIAYTPAYGSPTTGTNQYGTDVVVENGRITSIGGSDRAIPANGFVLSGHGAAGQWLSEHSSLGAKAETTADAVTITVDAEARVRRAELARDDARLRLAASRKGCVEFPEQQVDEGIATADRLIADARAALAAGDESRATGLAGQASQTAAAAADRTRESRPVEGRGLWVRPTETTPEAIRATLDSIDRAGFNMVFLETVWQGYTIFPSDAARAAGIDPQRPEMKGFDPLQVWVDEAHERGIELHAWVHTFFVGVDSAGGPGPVLTAHPEWAAVEREDVGSNGPRPSRQEPGYYFVDPAMPQPRAYIRSVFEEVLDDYAVDGLHLDYIRYPVSQPYDASFSYSDYSRQAFEKEYGVDPYALTPDDPQWEQWDAWRERNITTFVASVRDMQERVKPKTALSAAVFADPVDGLKKKFQNWGAWVDAGYMDFLTGMSFGSSPESVAKDTKVMRERVGDVPLYTATYGPFNGSPAPLMSDQLQAVKDADSDGTALFAYNQLNQEQRTALENGVYRSPAVAPHADPVKAARLAIASAREQIAGAAGSCAPRGGAAEAGGRLKVAGKLLASGENQIGPAVRQLEDVLNEVENWESDEQAAFSATTARDIRMITRWLRRHAG